MFLFTASITSVFHFMYYVSWQAYIFIIIIIIIAFITPKQVIPLHLAFLVVSLLYASAQSEGPSKSCSIKSAGNHVKSAVLDSFF